MRINQENCLFVMIDIQEKLIPVMKDAGELINNANILNKASSMLEIPLILTEQYPKGLGSTFSEIHIPDTAEKFEKNCFSIFNDQISESISKSKKNLLVMYGIESHICLLQSALDAIERGYKVMCVVDAVSSRTERSKDIAIRRLESLGVEMVSTEMLLFEILKTTSHPKFRTVSKLIK